MRLEACVRPMGVALLAALAACSSSQGGGTRGEATGTLGLALSVPGGITLDAINYSITGPTNTSGTVDLTNTRSSASFAVAGLVAGSGYTITLSGTDTMGDSCVSSPASFSIGTMQTTEVTTTIVCTQGNGGYVLADAGTGTVQVGAEVVTAQNSATTCPTIASFGAANTEFLCGTSTAVIVTTQPPGGAVAFSMVTTDDAGTGAGTITPTTTGGTFTCTNQGQVRLTVATAPVSLASDSGLCPSQSQSILINCEARAGVDGGAGASSSGGSGSSSGGSGGGCGFEGACDGGGDDAGGDDAGDASPPPPSCPPGCYPCNGCF